MEKICHSGQVQKLSQQIIYDRKFYWHFKGFISILPKYIFKLLNEHVDTSSNCNGCDELFHVKTRSHTRQTHFSKKGRTTSSVVWGITIWLPSEQGVFFVIV